MEIYFNGEDYSPLIDENLFNVTNYNRKPAYSSKPSAVGVYYDEGVYNSYMNDEIGDLELKFSFESFEQSLETSQKIYKGLKRYYAVMPEGHYEYQTKIKCKRKQERIEKKDFLR